jgi:hypothetical protein
LLRTDNNSHSASSRSCRFLRVAEIMCAEGRKWSNQTK